MPKRVAEDSAPSTDAVNSDVFMAASNPIIRVLSGINGAGKSSLLGSIFKSRNLTFFNPDEAARRIQKKTGWTIANANSEAWQYMVEKLIEAILNNSSFAFETTLGGKQSPVFFVRPPARECR